MIMIFHQIQRLILSSKILPFSSMKKYYHCYKCDFKKETSSYDYTLFCGNCSTLLDLPKNVNYFKLLGLEKDAFYLDEKSLSNAYKSLQRNLHPDKYVLKSDEEKEFAGRWSSTVNEAYQVLKNPAKRSQYLLELVSMPLLEGEVKIESDFLADMMELNEELEEISSSKDLESFDYENDRKLSKLFADFSYAMESENLEEARSLTAKIKYFINIKDKIKDLEEKFGIIK